MTRRFLKTHPMLFYTPLVHVIQYVLVRLDDIIDPSINRHELTIGDDDCDFDNDILVVIQSCR